MQELLNRWAGWAGLALSIIASMVYGVQGVAGVGFWIPMALGLGLLGLYLSRNASEVWAALSSRKTRLGANSVFLSLAALAIAALLMAIINNHDVSWDLSQGKVNTLSDETIKAVSGLSDGVQVYAFFEPSGGQQAPFEDLLKRVKKVNPSKFSYEFVNLNKKPMLAQQYSVRSYGTSVLVSGERHESITSATEEDLVNALLKLGSTGSKTVYVLSGHGELSLADSGPTGASELAKAFSNATFVTKDLNLVREGKVPDDAAALIIAGPKADFPKPELAVLEDWMAKGGRLVIGMDPRTPLPNLDHMVAQAGVQLGHDIVVDPIMRLFGGNAVAPLASTFDPSHPVTKEMRSGQQQLIFPLTQSVDLASPLPAGVGGAVLATSNPTAWAYKGTANEIPSKPGSGDKPGPVKLAAAVEGPGSIFKAGTPPGRTFRLVVFGTGRIMGNEGLALYNNQDIVVNSARWLADDEKRISIAAKKEESQPLLLDRGRIALMWWLILLLPFGVLGGGLLVLLRRRRAA